MTRSDYRNQTVKQRQAEAKLDRNTREVHFSYGAKLRFLACIHTATTTQREAMQGAQAIIMSNSRRDGIETATPDWTWRDERASKGRGKVQVTSGRKVKRGMDVASIGTSESPVAYASREQAETIASVETIDRETNYAMPTL